MYKNPAALFGGVGPRKKTILLLSGKRLCMTGNRSSYRIQH